MFSHLDNLSVLNPSGIMKSSEINDFYFKDKQIRLIVQTGIRKLHDYNAALTIRTTYTPPHLPPPYVDGPGDDGMVHYKYRGTDPYHSDNRALRCAM